MTPGRLNELRCPVCQQVSWVIDSDYRGMDGVMIPYHERGYACSSCRHDGPGWTLGQQSPPAFFLQPSNLYPMTEVDFDYWVGILRLHVPAHPALSRLDTTFRPCLPEEADAIKSAHEAARPVVEMKDQDGARRHEPDLRTAGEWLEIMKPGDALVFRRRDGGSLSLSLNASGHEGSCQDPAGSVLAHAVGLDEGTVREAILRYLAGDWSGCAQTLGNGNVGMLSRGWRRVSHP